MTRLTVKSDKTVKCASKGTPDDAAHHLEYLVGAIVAGETTALARLYELTVRTLFAGAYGKLRSKEDAEEIVFDVYKYVWQHAAVYDAGRGSVRAWLLIITKHRAIDRLRRRRAEISFDDPRHKSLCGALGSTSATPERLLESVQLSAATQHALQSLSLQRRNLLRLAYFEGLTHEQIAATVAIPLGTVKSHIRRALTALQRHLAAEAA